MTQDPFYESAAPAGYQVPPAAPPEKKNKTLIIIIVVAAVLLLCCCCTGAVWALWTYGDQIMYELDLNLLPALIN